MDTLKLCFRHFDFSDIKFSQDGSTLALASHDNCTYIYDTSGFALRARCEKHNSFITHIDFSQDGQFLQSTCGAYEHLYFDTSDGAHQPSPSALRDVEWATWTIPLGWPVQGKLSLNFFLHIALLFLSSYF